MHSPSRSQSLRTLLRRRNLIALLLPLALLVFVNPPSSLSANSGDLDTTFGTGGRVFVDFSLESTANAVALQPDGKIIVAGDEGKDVRFNYDETTNFALARLNTDGSLDTTFGTGGRGFVVFPRESTANAVALQPDGKIIVAGDEGKDVRFNYDETTNFALARLNTDGSLDTTFGTGGRVSTDISFSDRAFDVALQSDGKIVAAGLANDYSGGGKTEFALARYNADGSLDTSFGTGGKVRTGFGFHSGAMGLVIQADQKLVAAGYISDSAGSNAVALVRYNTDGSLDTSFGTGGVVRSSTVGDVAYAIALQADQKIVVAGRPQAVVARYNTDGSLDTTFGSGGRAIRNTAPSGDMRAVAVQSDGKIVAAGDQGGGNYLLLRYNADGSPDTGFGLDGFLTTDFGGFDQAEAVAIQPDGRIVAAGSSTLSWTLARYQPDGLLDQNFGSGGRATTDMSSGTINSQRAKGIVIQPDGRIVAAGRAYNGTRAVFGVTRYNVDNTTPTPTPSPSPSPSPSPTPSPTPTPTPSPTPQPTPSPGPPGTLDPTFGTGGKSFVDFIPASGARALARAPGNKLYIAGYAGSTTGQTDFALAKLNTDGSLDTTFGSGGRVTTDINLGDAANAIAVQADGKIVAAGSTNETSGSTVDRQKINFALVRYNADGSLDTSFDGDGKVVTDLYGATDIAYGVAIQPDQKIVVAGYTSTEFAPDIAFFGLVRYNADGSLDNTFGTNGKVRTSFNNSGTAYAVTIQADGKIVVVGEGACDFAVARYNTDGSLDATLGTGGKVQTHLGKSFCDFAYAVAIQTDGKIVAAGTLTSKFFALVRYNTDGSLDTTFDGDGRVVTEFENREAVATGIVIQPDGKIIAAGSAGPGFEPPGQPASTVALARYNADGSLDTTFDGDGRVLTSMGDLTHGSGARGVILQSDGTIVVAGAGYNGTKFTFAVARYFATDPLPAPLTTLHFAQSSYTVAEGAGSLNITVIRSGDTFNPASVKYATSDPTDAGLKVSPLRMT